METKRKCRPVFLTLLLLTLVLLPYLHQVAEYWHYTNDDAYITLRYSRNWAEGRGPFFNVGEHVEGYTNFLLMLLLSAWMKCGGTGSAAAAMKVLSVLCGGGVIVATFFLFRRVTAEWGERLPRPMQTAGSVIAAGCVATSPAFALNSTSGLETSLFSLCLVLGMLLGLGSNGRAGWAGLAFSLAVLTRPEGSLLFAVYWVTLVGGLTLRGWREGPCDPLPMKLERVLGSSAVRTLVLNVVVVAIVFLCHLLWRHHTYDGEWLPNTYFAKQGGFWAKAAWPYVSDGLLMPIFGVGGMVAAIAGFAGNRLLFSRGMLPVGAIGVTGALLPFVVGTDWMLGNRLVMPFLPAIAVTVAGGWLLLLSRIRRIGPAAAGLILAVVLVGLWMRQKPLRSFFYDRTRLQSTGYVTGHKALAEWIRTVAKPGDCIGLMDIGIVGYSCMDQRILDLTGLTDRFIAKSPGPFLNKQYDVGYVLRQRPEFLVLTLCAAGTSYTEPPEGTKFQTWTTTEAALSGCAEFQRWYQRKGPAKLPPSANWLDRFATQIGAVKVFEHAQPGLYYLLAVFHRTADPVNPAASHEATGE